MNSFMTRDCAQVCTYNQLKFPPDKNIVVDMDIPCTGFTDYGPYDLVNGYGNGKDMDGELYGLLMMVSSLGVIKPGQFSWVS